MLFEKKSLFTLLPFLYIFCINSIAKSRKVDKGADIEMQILQHTLGIFFYIFNQFCLSFSLIYFWPTTAFLANPAFMLHRICDDGAHSWRGDLFIIFRYFFQNCHPQELVLSYLYYPSTLGRRRPTFERVGITSRYRPWGRLGCFGRLWIPLVMMFDNTIRGGVQPLFDIIFLFREFFCLSAQVLTCLHTPLM